MIGEVLLENVMSIVGRSIIDHYYLFRNTRLRKDAVDRFNDEVTVVIRTYDHGHSHIYSLARQYFSTKTRDPVRFAFMSAAGDGQLATCASGRNCRRPSRCPCDCKGWMRLRTRITADQGIHEIQKHSSIPAS